MFYGDCRRINTRPPLCKILLHSPLGDLYQLLPAPEEKPADRWLQVGGRLLIVAVVVISVLDRRDFLVNDLWVPGAVLLVAGLSLSLVARLYLGRFYSEAVRIEPDHKLITRGPYHFVRHPTYLGVILLSLSAQ